MRRDRGNRRTHGLRSAGFTLIELMVTVAVIAILSAVAVPAMTGLINHSRISGLTGEVVSAIQLARSEAVRRNARVTLCPSTDGTTCANSTDWTGWIVLARDNTAATDHVMLAETAPGSTQVSGPAGGIVFRPSGLLVAQSQLTVCVPTTNPAANQRVVTVALSGSPITERANGGGQCP